MNRNTLDYGPVASLPEYTQTAWGAKALWLNSPDSFKLLPGQSDSFGSDVSKLRAWLNANLKDIRQAFSNACQQKRLTLGGNKDVVLLEDDSYKIVANPLGSHSHVSFVAWKKRRRWR